MYDIIIIGAGAAGLAAISNILKRNIENCLIIEATERVGGRILTESHNDHILEFGAQWIHGEDGNVVYSLAQRNNLINNEDNLRLHMRSDSVFIDENEEIIDAKTVNEFLFIMDNIAGRAETELANYIDGFGKYYTDQFKNFNSFGQTGEKLLDWYSKYTMSLDGSSSWFEPSGVGQTIYTDCPGNLLVNWKNGYHSLVKHFLKSIPNDKIKLNSPVSFINWQCFDDFNQPHVKVELSNGETIHSKHVIFTPSLGVLKSNHRQLFKPNLPYRKINSIQGLGIDAVDKIYLEFETRWWGDSLGFNLLNEPSDPKNLTENNWENGIFGIYEVFKQPRILCAWITGKSARIMESFSVEEVKNRVLKMLKHRMGTKFDVSNVIWCDRSNWYSNPYFKGSYSFRSVESEIREVSSKDLEYPLMFKGVPLVCFAGEATHPHFYSTVHGAVETGWREADRLTKYISECEPFAEKNSENRCIDFDHSDNILGIKHENTNTYPDCALADIVNKNAIGLLEKKNVEHYKVIIVGAGMAGISAAKTLENSGLNSILILEGTDRIGGRVRTVPVPSGGHLDLGAQWIHGIYGNSIYEHAKEKELISDFVSVDGEGDFFTEYGEKIDPVIVDEVMNVLNNIKNNSELNNMIPSNKDILNNNKNNNLPDNLEKNIYDSNINKNTDNLNNLENVNQKNLNFFNDYSKTLCKENCEDNQCSVGHFVDSKFKAYLNSTSDVALKKIKHALYQWNLRWEREDNSCNSLNDLSLKRWFDYSICEGPFNINPKLGMSSVFRSLFDGIKTKVQLSSEVVEIDYRDTKTKPVPIFITCSDGTQYHCDHVIVTSSIAFLKAKKNYIFKPPLPFYHNQAIDGIGFGTLNKIFLEFPNKFWDWDFTGLHLVWTDQIPDFGRQNDNYSDSVPDSHNLTGRFVNGTWTKMEDFWWRAIGSFDPCPGHSSTLCGWIAGPEAEYMETLPIEQVRDACMKVLKMFWSREDIIIPDPVRVYRSEWASNDLVLGSYSHRLSSSDFIKRDLIEDLNTPVCRDILNCCAKANTSEEMSNSSEKGSSCCEKAKKKHPVIIFAGEAGSFEYFSTLHGALDNGKKQAEKIFDFYNSM